MTKNSKLILIFSILGGLILVAGLLGYTAYAVYSKPSDNFYIRFVSRSLPVAKVGNRTVNYYKFLTMRDAIMKFINSDAGKSVGVTSPPEKELNKNILDRLVRILAVQDLAQSKNITVTDDEIKTVFADVVKAAASSTTPNVAEYLDKNYGWNEEDFKREVLGPALLEQKLGMQIANENNGDIQVFENAITERLSKPDIILYIKF